MSGRGLRFDLWPEYDPDELWPEEDSGWYVEGRVVLLEWFFEQACRRAQCGADRAEQGCATRCAQCGQCQHWRITASGPASFYEPVLEVCESCGALVFRSLDEVRRLLLDVQRNAGRPAHGLLSAPSP